MTSLHINLDLFGVFLDDLALDHEVAETLTAHATCVTTVLAISLAYALASHFVILPGTIWLVLSGIYRTLRDRVKRGRAKYPGWSLPLEIAVGVLRNWTHGFNPEHIRNKALRQRFRAQTDFFCKIFATVSSWRFGLSMIPFEANSVRCQWVGRHLKASESSPLGAEGISPDDVVLLYLHGGGYIAFSSHSHAQFAMRMLLATEKELRRAGSTANVRVVLVDYRLAPEHLFPSSIFDVVNTYSWLLKKGFKSKNISIMGDSGGGGLALSSLLEFKNRLLPMPSSSVCISPLVDISCTISLPSTDCFVPRKLAELCRDLYVGDSPNPQVQYNQICALTNDLSNFPPLMVTVGELEIYVPEARLLALRCDDYGVDCELKIYENMPHIFQMLADLIPTAQKSISDIALFLTQNMQSDSRKVQVWPLAEKAENPSSYLLSPKSLRSNEKRVARPRPLVAPDAFPQKLSAPKREVFSPRPAVVQVAA